jgi:hypothetical protein
MMNMKPLWERMVVVLALAAGLPYPPAHVFAQDSTIRRYAVEDVTPAGEKPDEACLALAVSLAFDADRVYVADAEDCAVKIFSKSGRFAATAGRKGQGPGELSFPSGVSVLGGRIFVADKFNRRIQVLDAAGRYLSGFAVPFSPDRILVLAADRILITHNPTGRQGSEKRLHVFDRAGRLLQEALPSQPSGDAVYDAFLNMILAAAGPRGEFFVVRRCQERTILRYGGNGELLETIPVDERYVFKPLTLPVQGPRKTIDGFCWDFSFDRDRFYLLAPAYTEEKDLGPGDQISVLDAGGRLEARIDLPVRVGKVAVDGDRIYAVDREGDLRVFRIVR